MAVAGSSSAAPTIQADLVVAGGGGGGLSAAVAAAEKGAKVVVLEKRNATGGNTAMAMGLFAAESPVQKRALVDASRDQLFSAMMDWAHWKVDPRIVRAYIDRSGDTIRWLEGQGCSFTLMPFVPNQTPMVLHRPSRRAAVTDALRKSCERLGATVLVQTAAEELLTGEGGEITGVVASTRGKRLTLHARAVVIATGGYGGNRGLLRKHASNYRDDMRCIGLPNMGDGLRMATAAGAATEGLGMLQIEGPCAPRPLRLMIDAGESAQLPIWLTQVGVEPYAVWVNRKGERFIDETFGHSPFVVANGVVRQPGGVCYALLDSAMVRTMTETGLLLARGAAGPVLGSALPGLERELRRQAEKGILYYAKVDTDLCNGCGVCVSSCPLDLIRLDPAGSRAVRASGGDECRLCQACERHCPQKATAILPAESTDPYVRIADSWEEIAAWIGADAEALKATLVQYNVACDRGHDPLFAKDRRRLVPLRAPPFYAIKLGVEYLDTIGGIKINERMEVLSVGGSAVPGLYAAGIDTGGWVGDTYCVQLAGTTFAFSINSGRIAGENAAHPALTPACSLSR